MESKRMALLGGRKTRSLPTQTFLPFPYYTIAVAGPGSDDHSQQENHFSVQEEESSLDCCKWESVECNPTTGRLTHLFLNLTAMNRYVGNPFLCGKPLPKNCSTSGPSSLPKRSTDKGLIDMTAFYASFGSSRRRSISF
ncbi:hypothetical protein V6N13_144659 [Hibiscus sabdariffa]